MANLTTTVRSFVAIELPGEVKSAISETEHRLGAALGPAARVVRWVQPESVHLTLLFLGDVPVRLLKIIEKELAEASTGVAPFSLRLGGLGVFPNLRRARVLWVGLENEVNNENSLSTLQSNVVQRLGKIGFPQDKPFRAHLTLGRVRGDSTQEHLAELGRAVESVDLRPQAVSFQVHELALMKSELRPGGSIYTRLAAIGLGINRADGT
ncbi:MAG TPA: RNA 2',3'-cyclic phosphodiesterase [Chloroflexia bacterium]|nr:RNA 2',3'-cyclic phosphodiesterase [Chloroflexia bacterium]